MIAKFTEAAQLLFGNLKLFSSIILTIWLPGNLLVNYLILNVFAEEDIFSIMRATSFIEGVFGPIYIAATIHVLARLKQGQRTTYSEAMAVGFQKWGSLFIARFVAYIIVLLGIIALVVPGVVLAVRYALLDPAVVLEGLSTSESRKRSAELTVGIRWEIFGAALLFYILFILFSFLIYLPLGFLPSFDNIATNVAIDCVLDITFAVIQIVMFLYYWDAAHQKPGDAHRETPSELRQISGSGM